MKENLPRKFRDILRLKLNNLRDRESRLDAYYKSEQDPELCFPGEVGGHGQLIDQIPNSEEIVLFYPLDKQV